MDTVRVLNLETGKIGHISRRLFEHPVFNPGTLVEADPEQKPYVQGMFKSRLTEPAIDPATVEPTEPETPEEEEDE